MAFGLFGGKLQQLCMNGFQLLLFCIYLLIPSRAQTVVGLCRWAYLSKIQLSNMMGREVYIPAFALSVAL